MEPSTSGPRPEQLLVHGRFLRALARGLVSDPASADDLVQDTWAAALAHPPSHAASPRGWLALILRRLSIKRGLRESQRSLREARAARVSASGEPEPPALLAEIELSRRVLEAVERLREPYRDTIYLRYYRGLLPQAIAEAQGAPLKTVKTRLARGLELLREDLDRQHGRRETWVALLLPLAGSALPPLERPSAPTTFLAPRVALGFAALFGAAAGAALYLDRDPVVVVVEEPAADAVASAPPAESAPSAPREREALEPELSGAPRPLARPAVVCGRLVGEDGAPLAGVSIRLQALALGLERPPFDASGGAERASGTVAALSGARGEFALALEEDEEPGELEEGGLVRIAFESDGLAPLALRRRVAPSQRVDLGELVLERGVTLSGRVLDPDGRPVAAAELLREDRDQGLALGRGGSGWGAAQCEQVAVTDDQGRFRVARQAAGAWRLEARAHGFAPQTLAGATHRPGEEVAGLELVLQPGATIRGRVVGLAPNELSGLELSSRPAGAPSDTGRLFAEQRVPVSAQGEFELVSLAPGEERELVVLRSGDGRPRPLNDPVRARAGSDDVLLTVGDAHSSDRRPSRVARLAPESGAPPAAGGCRLEVLVRDAGGEPVSDAVVAHRFESATLTRAGDDVRVTGADGRVEWQALAEGRHEFRVLDGVLGIATGAWRAATAAPGALGAVTLAAVPAAELRGTVRVDGAALLGAELRLRRDEAPGEAGFHAVDYVTASDARGRFRFPALPLGAYRLELAHASRAQGEARPLVLAAGGSTLDFELTDAHLAGVVRDGLGTPIAGAEVRVLAFPPSERPDFHRTERPGPGRASTDEAGRFELAGVSADQPLCMEVAARGFATLQATLERPPAAWELVLGEEVPLELELEGARPFAQLRAEGPRGEVLTFVLAGATTLHGLGEGTWRFALVRPPRGPRPLDALGERTVELARGRTNRLRWTLP